MKKILSLVVVLIAIGHLNAKGVESKSPVGMSVIKKGSLVKLFYRGEESGKVKVAIYTATGRTVFRETMQNTESFMRPYNFSALPSGEYTIEITDAQGKRYRKINHARITHQNRIAHLTRLNDGVGRYMLTVPNRGEDEIVVKIYDRSNSVVYQETEIISGNFAKIYDLNSIHGSHTFEITDKKGQVSRLESSLR